MAVVFLGSLLFWFGIGSELFPMVDAGTLEIRMKTLPGTRLEETEKIVARVEETIKQVIPENEIVTLISNIGLPVGKGAGFSTILSPNSGTDSAFLIINLKEEHRKVSTEEYTRRLRNGWPTIFHKSSFCSSAAASSMPHSTRARRCPSTSRWRPARWKNAAPQPSRSWNG